MDRNEAKARVILALHEVGVTNMGDDVSFDPLLETPEAEDVPFEYEGTCVLSAHQTLQVSIILFADAIRRGIPVREYFDARSLDRFHRFRLRDLIDLVQRVYS